MSQTTPIEGLLFTGDRCSICTVIKPKLEALLNTYDSISFKTLKTAEEPIAAASHSVFSVPTLLIFAEGKEYRRYHGSFATQTVKDDLDRLVALMED